MAKKQTVSNSNGFTDLAIVGFSDEAASVSSER
jgi:hypothetical protein